MKKEIYFSTIILLLFCINLWLSISYIDFFSNTNQMTNKDSDLISLNPISSVEEQYNGTTPDGLNINYSWHSWSNSSDLDNNSDYDTLVIYYNLTNFDSYQMILIEFEFNIFIDGSNISSYKDSKIFSKSGNPSENYLFKWMWAGRLEGYHDYFVNVTQHYSFEYDKYTYGYESFEFKNITRLNIVDDFSYEVEKNDRDLDGENDLAMIEITLNFTVPVSFALNYEVNTFWWNEAKNAWVFQSIEHFNVNETTMTQLTTKYNLYVSFYGNYMVNFSFSSEIQGEFLIIPIEVANLSRFNLVSHYTKSITTTNEDNDRYDDTIEINVLLNFTVTERVSMSIYISVISDYETVETHSDYFQENVLRGQMYNYSFKWHSKFTGTVRITMDFVDRTSRLIALSDGFGELKIYTFNGSQTQTSATTTITTNSSTPATPVKTNNATPGITIVISILLISIVSLRKRHF